MAVNINKRKTQSLTFLEKAFSPITQSPGSSRDMQNFRPHRRTYSRLSVGFPGQREFSTVFIAFVTDLGFAYFLLLPAQCKCKDDTYKCLGSKSRRFTAHSCHLSQGKVLKTTLDLQWFQHTKQMK